MRALRGPLEWLAVAGRRLEARPATFVESAPGAYAARSPDGYLGLGSLARFRLVLDLPHERAALLER